MKTGLTKRQKDTVICFNEESDIIDVRTHNTDLRNRLSEFSDEDYFSSELLYNKVRCGNALSESERISACPDRNFSARVFRYIKSQPGCVKTAEQIAIKTGSGSHDSCKVQIVLDAFCELGLLKNENGCYSAVENAAKVSLGSSELLRRLGYCD